MALAFSTAAPMAIWPAGPPAIVTTDTLWITIISVEAARMGTRVMGMEAASLIASMERQL